MFSFTRSLHEYLYTDLKRIDSYLEQISPDLKYEKIPEWSADLSFTGPKISSSQKIHTRQFTLHEKVNKLVDYLKANKYISELPETKRLIIEITLEEIKLIPFVIQRISATKVNIPPAPDAKNGKPITLWVCSNIDEDNQGSLHQHLSSICLMEDYSQNDAKIENMPVSVYSSLIGLLINQRNSIRSTILNNHPDFSLFLNYDDYKKRHDDIIIKYMRRNPVDVLIEAGCQIIGPCREIETLYRIRDFFQSSTMGLHLFGYPIFIRDIK